MQLRGLRENRTATKKEAKVTIIGDYVGSFCPETIVCLTIEETKIEPRDHLVVTTLAPVKQREQFS